MLGEGVERVCQPTGRVPAISVSALTVRAMISRSLASSIWACFSQRQPWQEISWPRATASWISQGESSAASPQVLTVAGTPSRSSDSAMRAGSVAPTHQMQAGTPCRLNSEKSSPPITATVSAISSALAGWMFTPVTRPFSVSTVLLT